MKLLKAALLAISTSVMLMPALSVKAQTATQCPASILSGNYAGNTITTLPNPGATVSQFVFNATTKTVSVLEISNNGVFDVKQATAGSIKNFYSDYCLAQVLLDFGGGDVRNYYFYIDDQGKELRYIQTDKGVVSSGTARRQ